MWHARQLALTACQVMWWIGRPVGIREAPKCLVRVVDPRQRPVAAPALFDRSHRTTAQRQLARRPTGFHAPSLKRPSEPVNFSD